MTKRHSIPSFALLLLFSIAALPAQDFTYTNNNGTITITGYTGPGGNVTIPSTIDGLPVINIGNRAFTELTSLTGVTIPGSVTDIGAAAFAYCSRLTSLRIPGSVTNIE